MLLRHPYHMVEPSPWPLLTAASIFVFALGMIQWLGGRGASTVTLGLLAILSVAIGWWRDVLREALGGYHTRRVRQGLTMGLLLFFVSEIMLFFSFFWAYFHHALSPAAELGAQWPPVAIRAVDPWGVPLLGSVLLLSSGFTVTLAHHAVRCGDKSLTVAGLLATVLLGGSFVALQAHEYSAGEATMADGAFGSVFYMTTGLHGSHVIIGVLFLAVCLVRLLRDRFSAEHHLGLEFAILYWHLVDLVWFFVFTVYYWWGSSTREGRGLSRTEGARRNAP